MKNLAVWFAVLVLSLPIEVWKNASEYERDLTRHTAIMDYLSNPSFAGKKFRIWEEIKDGNWQLHVEEEKVVI